MLLNLQIRNFAIIDAADIDFQPGFTVVTGETGAGKSILIDALTIALGGRASASVIRTGQKSAQVEALFDLSLHTEVKQRLESRDLLGEDPNLLLVRRVVAAKGRGKVTVNGRLSTVAALSEVVRGLVDISGQHDQQSLLIVENHLDILDAYAGSSSQKKAYVALFEQLKGLQNELEALERDEAVRLQQLDFARFQLEEIERLSPVAGEDEALENEVRRLSGAEKLQTGTQTAEHLLYSEDGSAFDKVGKAIAEVEALARIDTELAPCIEGLESARRELEECARTLSRYGNSVDSDPARLDEAENRLVALRRLARKHGGDLGAVLDREQELQREVEQCENSDARRAQIAVQLGEVWEDLLEAGAALTQVRMKAAAQFSQAVSKELSEMELEEARFEAQLEQRASCTAGIVRDGISAGAMGLDDVEFLWSANRGESLRPLNKTASGGELSRLMLAVKHVLCSHDLVSLYVFDEVDTGLGGKAADSIGRKIQAVARGHQAITITHLASIASRADQHLYVCKKVTDDSRTVSSLSLIEGEVRIKELARMIDGNTSEGATLTAAAQMLERARSAA